MTTPWIIAFACLCVLVLLLGFSVIGVMRRMVGVLERAERLLSQEFEGAPPLTRVPPFELVDESGETASSTDLIRESTIVLFMEAGCKSCRTLAQELLRPEIGQLPLLVIAGEAGLGDDFGLAADIQVFRQYGGSVAKLFKSIVTPHAFVVDGAGVVLDRVVPGSVADLEQMAKRQEAGASRLAGVAGD
jgi:hypothetical protein